MKQVHPNLTDMMQGQYVAQLSMLRKFKRYWGTEIVNGVEVFTGRKYYYPEDEMDESTRKLAKHLGVLSDVTADQEGIRSAWFYLNPQKTENTESGTDNNQLIENMNTAFNGPITGTVTIAPKVVHKGGNNVPPIMKPVGMEADEDDFEGLRAEVLARIESWWQDGYTILTDQHDPYLAVIFSLILRSSQINFEINSVTKTNSNIILPAYVERASSFRAVSGVSWDVSVTVPAYTFTSLSDLVIMAISSNSGSSKRIGDLLVRQSLIEASTPISERDGSDGGIADVVYPSITGDLDKHWLNADQYYLKTSILDDPSFNRKALIDYLYSSVDTNYRKKKAKWYETVLAIVLVIVAVYFGQYPAAKAAAAYGGIYSTIVLVSVTLTLASLYISLMMAILSVANVQGVTSALGSFMKTVEPLVKIASIATIVLAFRKMVQDRIAEEAAREAAGEAAREASQSALRTLVTDLADFAMESLRERIETLTNFTDMTMEQALKLTSMVMDTAQRYEMKQLEKELRGYRSKLAEYDQAREQSQTSDLLKELALTYPNLLAEDNSIYASLYDRPYEWWATPFHTGCIQANTVNALWLSD